MIPGEHLITKDAQKRLKVLQELDELGGGFRLAAHDLEIRGAGNLLGAEQSGFIADIGFELYQKIVEEAVEELKREEFQDLFKDELSKARRTAFGRKRLEGSDDVSVSLGLDALIPSHYVEDDAERFRFYQRFAGAKDERDLASIVEEMKDRFGPLPEEALALAQVARIREKAKHLGVRAVTVDDPTRTLRMLMPNETEEHFYKQTFPLILDRFPLVGQQNIRLVNERRQLRLIVRLKSKEAGSERIVEIEDLLQKLTPEEILPRV
jgi:transcription-repair coupling factor (superfamily II helicase)